MSLFGIAGAALGGPVGGLIGEAAGSLLGGSGGLDFSKAEKELASVFQGFLQNAASHGAEILQEAVGGNE